MRSARLHGPPEPGLARRGLAGPAPSLRAGLRHGGGAGAGAVAVPEADLVAAVACHGGLAVRPVSCRAVDFREALRELGFTLRGRKADRGEEQYALAASEFLTYWVHVYADGTALFTWEFAIAEYVAERGLAIGSNETLNLFMFPRDDERGPQDPAWLAGRLDAAEARLASIRFAGAPTDRPAGPD